MLILFSPVGGTDPISERNLHDGALLHIARHFKPDCIYLFMSKEILERKKKDDRYRFCLNKLGERLGHTFDIREISYPDLDDVHKFDIVSEIFEQELKKIVNECGKDDKLLLNITSGTPAMKNSLHMLAAKAGISCECVQVDTPNKHNLETEYQVELLWEQNLDNQYTPEDEYYNRTHIEKNISDSIKNIDDFIQFDKLSAEKFELLCKEILAAFGFGNIISRGNTNASDGGVDIECEEQVKEIFQTYTNRWIFQCKHMKAQIDRKDISEIPDLLNEFKAQGYGIFYTGTFTPQTIDRLKEKTCKNDKIKYWDGFEIKRMISQMEQKKKQDLIYRYFISADEK